MFWKDFSKKVFPNEIALEYDLSSTIRKNDISFSRKYEIVSCQKVKDDLSQKIHGNMMFSMYSVKMVFFSLQTWNYSSVKKAKIIFSRKIHLKMAFPASRKKMMLIIVKMILAFVINIPERVPMILCTFMDIILRVFIYFFPMKKTGNLYIGSKFDFICKLYSWRYIAIKNLQYSVTVSPQVLYLEVFVSVN